MDSPGWTGKARLTGTTSATIAMRDSVYSTSSSSPFSLALRRISSKWRDFVGASVDVTPDASGSRASSSPCRAPWRSSPSRGGPRGPPRRTGRFPRGTRSRPASPGRSPRGSREEDLRRDDHVSADLHKSVPPQDREIRLVRPPTRCEAGPFRQLLLSDSFSARVDDGLEHLRGAPFEALLPPGHHFLVRR